ncbi:hypothetical protein KRP22_001444 [Phytophthora ramorum]|nr:bZIP transcription factor 1 [Phytophthora ramorum]
MASLLGDNLIGHVLPRVPINRSQAGLVGITLPNLDASRRINAPRDERQATNVVIGDLLPLVDTARSTPSEKATTNYYSTDERRQQCRTNQARYRAKQRNAHIQLEKSVKQLHQEVDGLKRRYRDLSSRERSNQSPWSIVAEVFRLLENSFRFPWRTANAQEMSHHQNTRQILAVLERSFAHDAAMGEVSGTNALMKQLRCYSLYFGDPILRLQRIESVAPGVMEAKSSLSVTVTELTLQHIFKRPKKSSDGIDEQHRLLCGHFLGQRLQLCCSMRFLFDEESGRVVRLVTSIDLLTALLRVQGNLNDVLCMLEHAFISPECVIDLSNR